MTDEQLPPYNEDTDDNKEVGVSLTENKSGNILSRYTKKDTEDTDAEDTDGLIVPSENEINRHFITLDQVALDLKDRNLLCQHSFNSVQDTAQKAKKGKISLKTKDTGRSY